ncbi:MAG: peptide chain release factor N(5)-glutamine methyltransferase [Hyphomicrobiaceae bacterium]
MTFRDTAAANGAATVGAVVRGATERLRAGGIEDAARDARRLVALAAGLAPIDVITAAGRELTKEQLGTLDDMLLRRIDRRMPVSRIEGVREFYGRPFQLNAGTLDPRSDTETVVMLALDVVRQTAGERPLRILDAGVGSGAILLTLLAELPNASGIGIDTNEDALRAAGANAQALGVARRAGFIQADMAAFSAPPFDLVVSNPPYIPSGDIARLEPEVREHDPRGALDGGRDGLDFYWALAGRRDLLVHGGWMVLEVGAGQADAVADMLASALSASELRKATDLGGHTRAVAVRTHL